MHEYRPRGFKIDKLSCSSNKRDQTGYEIIVIILEHGY